MGQPAANCPSLALQPPGRPSHPVTPERIREYTDAGSRSYVEQSV